MVSTGRAALLAATSEGGVRGLPVSGGEDGPFAGHSADLYRAPSRFSLR
jgi:hypothetical protein